MRTGRSTVAEGPTPLLQAEALGGNLRIYHPLIIVVSIETAFPVG
jgi:hypothetical protein